MSHVNTNVNTLDEELSPLREVEPMADPPTATPAQLVETEIRLAMSRLPKASWETRQIRRDDLAWIDAALDQYLELTR